MANLTELRRALWHLRKHGISGLQKHLAQRSPAPVVSTPALPSSKNDDTCRTRHTETTEVDDIGEWRPVRTVVRRPELSVVVLAPRWLERSLAYEFSQVDKETLRTGGADLLLVAPPWGVSYTAVVSHIREASANGVPTALWDTEGVLTVGDDDEGLDNLHQQTKTVAELADATFTTHPSPPPGALHLPIAVQPLLHNPVRTETERHDRDVVIIASTGSDLSTDESVDVRSAQASDPQRLSSLIDGTVDVLPCLRTGLDVYGDLPVPAEHWSSATHTARRFPEVTVAQRETLMRRYAVALESRPGKEHHGSRDAAEFLASGTALVSYTDCPATGTVRLPGITMCSTREDVGSAVRALTRSIELRDRLVHRAQRSLWAEHTYSHRTDRLLSEVAKNVRLDSGTAPLALGRHVLDSPRPKVTVLAPSIRAEHLDRFITMMNEQVGVDVQLALTVADTPSHLTPTRVKSTGMDTVVLDDIDSEPVGNCLNRLVDTADGDFVARIDGAHHYGPNFLTDSIAALEYSSADIVGKQAHYVYVARHDVTALRFPEKEHRYTDYVVGPTIVSQRTVMTDNPFPPLPIGEDVAFLRRAVAGGGRVYSADRFGFAMIDHGYGTTSHRPEMEVLASANVHTRGFSPTNVDV